MTSYVTPKKNTEFIFYVGLTSQANTKIFQANPTLATGDAKVSTDGGSLGNLTTIPAVTPSSSKMVKVTLSAGEMNGDNVTVVFSDAAGDEWCDLVINIQTSARQVDDLSILDAQAVRDAMKLTPSGGAAGSGSIDNIVSTIDTNVSNTLNDTNELQTDWANGGRLDNILDTVNSTTAGASMVTDLIYGAAVDILTDTGTTIPELIDNLNDLASGEVGDAVLDEVVEGSLTLRQIMRLTLAALANKASGGGTTTITFRDLADSKARITATVDANGNRTAVTLDGS